MKDNFYDIVNELDSLIEKLTPENLDRIEALLEKKGVRQYFFKKLSMGANVRPWLEPLKQKGYFAPSQNPLPKEDPNQKGYFKIPYWDVLEYLETVAKQNAENPSAHTTTTLLEIADSIIDYRNKDGERIDNYITDATILKVIFSLPTKYISEKHIDFIETILTSRWHSTLTAGEISKIVFPRLIESKSIGHILKLLDIVLQYRKEPDGFGVRYSSIMDDYWLDKSLKKHKAAIADLCGIEAAKVAIGKMKALLGENSHGFNRVWIPTIEDHPQTTFRDRYECQLVHFVRDMLELSEPQKVRDEVIQLLDKEHEIFRRIAVHTINHHYHALKDLFWNWRRNPLDDDGLKHELYELIKAHSASFSDDEIERLLEWIESKKYRGIDDIKDDQKVKKVLAYRKKEWLSALIDSGNPEVISLYQSYNEIEPAEWKHPGFDTWGETWAGTISPIEVTELLGKSNEELAEYLTNFKEEGGWRQPTKEGLSHTLRSCVVQNPRKFAEDLKPFLKVPTLYQQSLIWGLCDAWREQKDFEWDGVLNYVLNIIQSDAFWIDEENAQYRDSIVIQIADLIEKGTEVDKHAFDPDLLPMAENILLLLADRAWSTVKGDENDLVTAVLNSPKGRVFSAMVVYSLRYARLYKKKDKDRWPPKIKADFNRRLDRKVEASLDFSLTLGKYLPNIAYLDMEWLKTNVNRIFIEKPCDHWNAAMVGYLFYGSRVHQELYFLLREKGHYAKALQTRFSNTYINERLIQHICVGYIEGWENLEDKSSLISKVIHRSLPDELSEILSFFWMLRKNLNDKIRSKVKPLWKAIVKAISDKKDKLEYQKILSNLSKWLVLVERIDKDIYIWLKLSARYINADFNTSFFVDYLLEHMNKTLKEVGELYIEMLNSGAYPDYKKDNIQGIVRQLYQKGYKELADEICNSYGEQGLYFLRDIYEQYNKES